MDVSTAAALLEQESAELDQLVDGFRPEQWALNTPSVGWTIADQIAHLHWTDLVATQSLRKDPAFDALVADVLSGARADTVDSEAHRLADQSPQELVAQWRAGRQELLAAASEADPAVSVSWFGPPMRPLTMITARIMETWAHGLDVFDTIGEAKPAGPALAAVARIGVRTRDFAFTSRGLEVPEADIRVELSMPDDSLLSFGPETAQERVEGSAWAFAAVVTQRRHIDDVRLEAHGPAAAQWLDIAQAFAGHPSRGPAAGQRTTGGRR